MLRRPPPSVEPTSPHTGGTGCSWPLTQVNSRNSCGFRAGNASRRTFLATVKMAVFAPIPNASDTMAMMVSVDCGATAARQSAGPVRDSRRTGWSASLDGAVAKVPYCQIDVLPPAQPPPATIPALHIAPQGVATKPGARRRLPRGTPWRGGGGARNWSDVGHLWNDEIIAKTASTMPEWIKAGASGPRFSNAEFSGEMGGYGTW